MSGRLTGCVIVLTCVLLPRQGTAQVVPGAPGGPPSGAWGAPETVFAPAPGAAHFGPDPAMYGPPPGPAMYGPSGPGPEVCPPGYGPAGGSHKAAGGGHAGYYDNKGADYWTEPSPLETVLGHYLKNGYLRLEYMNFNIESPGDTLLGAPLALIRDPTRPFAIFDESIPPNQIGEGFVPSLSSVGLNEQDGLRATWGLPFVEGDLEITAFWIERADSVVDPQGLRPASIQPFFGGLGLFIEPGSFVGTPLLQDGVPSDTLLLFNEFFRARWSTEIWSAEAVWIPEAWPFSQAVRSEAWRIRPMLGFQYLDVNESLEQLGGFRDTPVQIPEPEAPLPPLLVTSIDSHADNDIYGAVLGMRMEFNHEWFSIVADPRVTLGANVYDATVSTENLRFEADPRVTTANDGVHGTAVLQLNVLGKLHVHENFSLIAGWTGLYVTSVTRPDGNIVYNDLGLDQPPGVVVDANFEDLTLGGATGGGEMMVPANNNSLETAPATRLDPLPRGVAFREGFSGTAIAGRPAPARRAATPTRTARG